MIMNLGPTGSRKLPAITYTGRYEVTQDEGKQWRVRFLSSGTLTLKGLHQAVDLFCVGGGGGGHAGGGGGGYTKTAKNLRLKNGTSYTITVGSGGAAGGHGSSAGNGGTSSVKLNGTSLCSANGGGCGLSVTVYGSGGRTGGNGGSGGGGQTGYDITAASGDGQGDGGTNGGNGKAGYSCVDYEEGVGDIWWTTTGGTGQGTTTREFGDANGTLYSTGGYGYYKSNAKANSGNGGSNTRVNTSYGAGSSGVVVMRSAV